MARTKRTAKERPHGRGKTIPVSAGKTPRTQPQTQGQQRKKRRFKPGTQALWEIRRYQKSCDLLIRKRPFQRLVREIAQEFNDALKFTADALLSLQVSELKFCLATVLSAFAKSLNRETVQLLTRTKLHSRYIDLSASISLSAPGRRQEKFLISLQIQLSLLDLQRW